MEINPANLSLVNTGFKAHFNNGFAGAAALYGRVATTVPSTGAGEDYGWLGAFPRVREWIGDRHVHDLAKHEYRIKNRDFELTVGVPRNAIKDDVYGVYSPAMQEFGQSVAEFPDELVFGLLAAGDETKCYDNQYFFDTDHPVGDASVSNYQAGAGPLWILLDTTRALKPVIYQDREKFNFVAKTSLTDDEVFNRKKFIWGTDGRCNVGFGFWQMAFASRAPLTAENYEAARAAMGSLKSDTGKKLNIKPNLLLHASLLEGAARRLLVNSTLAGGGDNEWKGTAEPLKITWLDD